MLNKKVFVALAIVAVLLLGLPAIVSAQAADDESWSSSITYYTPSDTLGNLQISYYLAGSDVPIQANPITLNPHAAGSLYIGSTAIVGMPTSFSGSAVLSSDVPVVATYVQFSSSNGSAYPRPLYTGFSPADAAATFFIPTFLNNRYGTNTSIGIQNVEATDITADVKLYAAGAATPSYTKNVTIKSQSTVLMRGEDFGMPAGTVFDGSVVIEGTGKVIASAIEYSTVGRDAKAFEGMSAGATTVYMASAMCEAYNQGFNSYYAIQNAGTVSTVVDVDYYNTSGSLVTSASYTINAGSKRSVNACADGAAVGYTGSAVITSDGQPLMVVGKIAGATISQTAFVGQAAGATKVAAPYIRWSVDGVVEGGWRSYVAIMNVGSTTATSVVANYYDKNGTLVGTHNLGTLGQYIKVNTNPNMVPAALDANGNFGVGGGAIEIVSDQPVVVVTRVSTTQGALYGVGQFAEDYNGVAIPD